MADNRKIHHRVLFIDDDESFLIVIQRLIAKLSDGMWDVQVAASAEQALNILRQMQVDLITVDVEMPKMDGVELLGVLHRHYPQIPQVALTGLLEESRQEACLAKGAQMCLQKPMSLEEATVLYNTFAELAQVQLTEGFFGVLRKVELMDLLHIKCAAGNSTLVEAYTNEVRGTIYVQSGAVVHACCGNLKGEEAFSSLISLSACQFKLKPFTPPAERTISKDSMTLLREALLKRDQAGRPAQRSAPTEAPHPSLAEAAADRLSASPALGSNFPSPAGLEEVVLCSGQGEVLYEWQCPDRNLRIDFLEFLTRKSWQIGLGLPLGQFERLEVQGPQSRLVTQLGPGRGLLIRCGSPAPTPAAP